MKKNIYILQLNNYKRNCPKAKIDPIVNTIKDSIIEKLGEVILGINYENNFYPKKSVNLKFTLSLFEKDVTEVLIITKTTFSKSLGFIYKLSDDIKVITTNDVFLDELRTFVIAKPLNTNGISQKID